MNGPSKAEVDAVGLNDSIEKLKGEGATYHHASVIAWRLLKRYSYTRRYLQ